MTPPGSVQVVLQEVLELAAKNFVQDKRYKSDLRYLKVWIQYVRHITLPLESAASCLIGS